MIRRLVADLNLPVAIEAVPTVREADGLAMSSRNALLSPDERRRALALSAGAARGRAAGRRGRALGAGALTGAVRARARPRRRRAGVRRARRPRHARAARAACRRGPAGGRRARRRRATDRQRAAFGARARHDGSARKPDRKGDRDVQRVMLKSKIHRATVTDCDLHYVGSITIDPDLLEAARHPRARAGARRRRRQRRPLRDLHDRRPARLGRDAASTAPPPGSCTTATRSSSSPTAHYDEADLERYEPSVVHVEAKTNRIITIDDEVATLLS